MSRLGIFACLFMVVAVAVCVDMPTNTKAPELPKDGAQKPDARVPQVPPLRQDGARPDAPRVEGRPDLPKADSPKPDAKPPQDGKS